MGNIILAGAQVTKTQYHHSRQTRSISSDFEWLPLELQKCDSSSQYSCQTELPESNFSRISKIKQNDMLLMRFWKISDSRAHVPFSFSLNFKTNSVAVPAVISSHLRFMHANDKHLAWTPKRKKKIAGTHR